MEPVVLLQGIAHVHVQLPAPQEEEPLLHPELLWSQVEQPLLAPAWLSPSQGTVHKGGSKQDDSSRGSSFFFLRGTEKYLCKRRSLSPWPPDEYPTYVPP